MNQVLQTDQFRAAIKEIGKYIARESGSRKIATDFLQRIGEKCQIYARQPELGELRPEVGEGLRCFHVGNYVIFYRPHEKGVLLLAIIHGARDIPAVFRRLFDTR
jgi:toxin ParE1/3/4